ncbi:MAG: DUF4256 domain-containing protein [Chthoniobacterales bacterium]
MKMNGVKGRLSAADAGELLVVLKQRFAANPERHAQIEWKELLARLEGGAGKLWSLGEMERTGGEPDVIGRDSKTGEFVFMDCSSESPAGRRGVCYDRRALDSRKEHRPKTSADDLATEMGVEMLTEEEYGELQTLGEFDLKTSSWVRTPEAIRERGGALYCERRFGRVFVGHNGAQSYYGVRGFRAALRV